LGIGGSGENPWVLIVKRLFPSPQSVTVEEEEAKRAAKRAATIGKERIDISTEFGGKSRVQFF
jgi:hypothetical protein